MGIIETLLDFKRRIIKSEKTIKVMQLKIGRKTYNSHTCNMHDSENNERRYTCEYDYNSIWTNAIAENSSYNNVNLPVIDILDIGKEVIVYNAGTVNLNVHSKTPYGFTQENSTFNPSYQIYPKEVIKFTWGLHGSVGWQISKINENTSRV